jgi:DNA repair protein RadC
VLTSPKPVQNFLTLKLGMLEYEVYSCAYLENRHRLIEFVELFRGTINGASVHPREVVKQALQLTAAAVIFEHPRPSGVAEPSHADVLVMSRLKGSLAIVDIHALDYLIVAGTATVSFAEQELLGALSDRASRR